MRLRKGNRAHTQHINRKPGDAGDAVFRHEQQTDKQKHVVSSPSPSPSPFLSLPLLPKVFTLVPNYISTITNTVTGIRIRLWDDLKLLLSKILMFIGGGRDLFSFCCSAFLQSFNY